MESEDLKEVRALFERSEQAKDPVAKLPLLRNAVEAAAAYVEDPEAGVEDVRIKASLYRTYIRRNLAQLLTAPRLSYATMLGYENFLLFPKSALDRLLEADSDLVELRNEFLRRAAAASRRTGP